MPGPYGRFPNLSTRRHILESLYPPRNVTPKPFDTFLSQGDFGFPDPTSVEDKWVLSPWGKGEIPSGMRRAVNSPYPTGTTPIEQTLPLSGEMGNSPYTPPKPRIPNAFEGTVPEESTNAFRGLANYTPKPSMTSRVIGGLAKAGEIGTVAGVGNSLLEALAPSDQYWTPADVGSYIYDKIFGAPSGLSAKDATQMPNMKGGNNVGIPGELESLSPERRDSEGNVILPARFSKDKKVGSGKTGMAKKFKLTLKSEDLSGMHELPEIPEPKTMDLPDYLPSRDLSDMVDTMSGLNKSDMLPDKQQSSQSAIDRYMDIVSHMPQRSDYKPGIGRRIAAGLIGAATGFSSPSKGFQAALDVNQSPYNRAVQDWGTELEELKPLMVAENQREMNQTRVNEQARKTDLINASKQFEAETDRMFKQGILKDRAVQGRLREMTLAHREALDSGKLELAKEIAKDMKEYRDEQVKISKSNAASNATRAAASAKNAETSQKVGEARVKHMSAQSLFEQVMQDIANKNKEK